MADSIPRIAHFVFGLRTQDEPFHLVHYLALESCLVVVQPDEIHLHCCELPYGFYWDLARAFVTVHRVGEVDTVAEHDYNDPFIAHFSYAHEADFVRLDVLAEHGGLYADIDTLFLTPPADALWGELCVIGRESDVVDPRSGMLRSSLSNALIMAAPGAPFVERWRGAIADSFDGTWSAHSCFLAHDLAAGWPDIVRVEPERTFHPFPPTAAGIRQMLIERHDDLEGIVSMHLAAHLWWDADRRDFAGDIDSHIINERWVRDERSTYAHAAARFLPAHGCF